MATVTINGKNINIPDKEIKHLMETTEVTKEEAIEMWLCDNDYIENEEQNILDEKAKGVKIDHGATSVTEKKPKKPKTVKVSDEKTTIFSDIVEFLEQNYTINVVTANKMLEINLNGKNFKLNLSETRPPKPKK